MLNNRIFLIILLTAHCHSKSRFLSGNVPYDPSKDVDIRFSLTLNEIKGMLLYCADVYDGNVHKFAMEFKRQAFEIKYDHAMSSSDQKICGCHPSCLNKTIHFQVSFKSDYVTASCNDGNAVLFQSTRNITIHYDGNMKSFPIPKEWSRNMTRLFYWMGNVGPYEGFDNVHYSPMRNDLNGCIMSLRINGVDEFKSPVCFGDSSCEFFSGNNCGQKLLAKSKDSYMKYVTTALQNISDETTVKLSWIALSVGDYVLLEMEFRNETVLFNIEKSNLTVSKRNGGGLKLICGNIKENGTNHLYMRFNKHNTSCMCHSNEWVSLPWALQVSDIETMTVGKMTAGKCNGFFGHFGTWYELDGEQQDMTHWETIESPCHQSSSTGSPTGSPPSNISMIPIYVIPFLAVNIFFVAAIVVVLFRKCNNGVMATLPGAEEIGLHIMQNQPPATLRNAGQDGYDYISCSYVTADDVQQEHTDNAVMNHQE